MLPKTVSSSDDGITSTLLGGRPSNRNSYRKLNSFNNAMYAILFMVNTIIIFGYAMVYGVIAVSGVVPQTIHVSSSGNHKSAAIGHFSTDFVCGLFLLCAVGSILSMLMVYAMSKFSNNIIITGLCIVALCSMLIGIGMLFFGIYGGGFFLIVFSVFSGWFLYYIRPRIRFASANLRIACEAISNMPRLFYYASIIIGIEFLWCILWCMAAYGVATNAADDTIYHGNQVYNLAQCVTYIYGGTMTIDTVSYTCDSKHSNCRVCFCDHNFISNHSCYTESFYPGYYALMIISILWACSVFSNIIHCTSAGAVAIWWKTNNELFDSDAATTTSFITAILYDFGAICLGSLFVAISKGLRNIVSFAMKQLPTENSANNNPIQQVAVVVSKYLMNVLEFLLKILDLSLEYFNRYAFTYVAVYGYNFTDASQSVIALFKGRGWDAIINDDIIDSVIFFCNITIGILTMAIGMIYGHYTHMTNVDYLFFSLIGFTIGYVIGMVALKIIIAAVAAIYVLFAEHPEALEESHDVLYYELLHSWQEMYPNAVQRVPSTDRSPSSNQNTGKEFKKAMNSVMNVFSGFLGNSGFVRGDEYEPVQTAENGQEATHKNTTTTTTTDAWSYKSLTTLVQDRLNTIVAPGVNRSSQGYMVSENGTSEDLGFSL